MNLYTKNGKPLQTQGDRLYSHTGKIVGRIQGGQVFGPDGRYVGTLVQDRLVHRSSQSARMGAPFASVNQAGTARGPRAAAALWGDEPEIPA